LADHALGPAAGGLANAGEVEGTDAELPDAPLLEDARVGENLGVVAHERHADAERFGEHGAAHGAVAGHEIDHVHPPRIGQRLEDAGALFGGHATGGHVFP
jgi:hypothetical protein